MGYGIMGYFKVTARNFRVEIRRSRLFERDKTIDNERKYMHRWKHRVGGGNDSNTTPGGTLLR